MAHEVTETAVPARPTAVIRATTTWAEYPELWRRLLDEVHAGVQWHGGGHKGRNVMVYRDVGDDLDVEVGVELDQAATVDPRLARSELPAGVVAATVHRGPYQRLGDAHHAVLDWCQANGRPPTGVRWEVYGHWHDDPAQLETEVSYVLGEA